MYLFCLSQKFLEKMKLNSNFSFFFFFSSIIFLRKNFPHPSHPHPLHTFIKKNGIIIMVVMRAKYLKYEQKNKFSSILGGGNALLLSFLPLIIKWLQITSFEWILDIFLKFSLCTENVVNCSVFSTECCNNGGSKLYAHTCVHLHSYFKMFSINFFTFFPFRSTLKFIINVYIVYLDILQGKCVQNSKWK